MNAYMDSAQIPPFATLSYEWSKEYYSQSIYTMNNPLFRPVSIWFLIVVYILGALILFIIGDGFDVCFGLYLCLYAIYMIWNKYKGDSVSAIYKSCKMYKDLVVFYEFYDKHFVVKDKYGTNTIPYDMLYTIKSSTFGYVLCTSNLCGLFIPKEFCSNELILFIENLRNAK